MYIDVDWLRNTPNEFPNMYSVKFHLFLCRRAGKTKSIPSSITGSKRNGSPYQTLRLCCHQYSVSKLCLYGIIWNIVGSSWLSVWLIFFSYLIEISVLTAHLYRTSEANYSWTQWRMIWPSRSLFESGSPILVDMIYILICWYSCVFFF